MKKILCYIALVLLVMVIVVPPLSRALYKDKEDDNTLVPDKVELLVCNKDNYNISSSYKNDAPINIKFTKLSEDTNLSEYSEKFELEYLLNDFLSNQPVVNRETSTNGDGKELISYLLIYTNIDASLLTELKDYRLPLESQKSTYESKGYTCNVIK